ncbi:hypothetical protein HK101_001115 [Irineochytrium annulatum]|nr:hypothetical protein HK101_001115 [Irineochytrium annulatum]
MTARSLCVVLASAGLAAAQTYSLFEGDSCNMHYPNFNAPPSPNDITVVEGAVSYQGGNMQTTRYLLYGTLEARIKAGPHGGVVTALTLINNVTLDEIDWEFVGADTSSAWTNFFFHGLRERDPKTTFEIWASHPTVQPDPTQNFHDYRVDWTPYNLTWYVDGNVVHSQDRLKTWEPAGMGDGFGPSHYHYPTTPLQLKFGVWNSQAVPWSQGPIDWNSPEAANGFSASFASIKITCYNGPYPSNMDAPPTDPAASDTLGTAPNGNAAQATAASATGASATSTPGGTGSITRDGPAATGAVSSTSAVTAANAANTRSSAGAVPGMSPALAGVLALVALMLHAF